MSFKFRTGFGYDVHKLARDESFWLGGIKLTHYKGCIAHSDGDALIHAICDALLGAAGLRDIGYYFPDTDEKYRNADSKQLLAEVCSMLRNKSFEIGNIDGTIALQKPKIKDKIPQMLKTLAKICEISEDDFSLKATTTEKLGFVGKEDGIEAFANVLIYKI